MKRQMTRQQIELHVCTLYLRKPHKPIQQNNLLEKTTYTVRQHCRIQYKINKKMTEQQSTPDQVVCIVTKDTRYQCGYCLNPKTYTISTMVGHLNICVKALTGSGKFGCKQEATKVVAYKRERHKEIKKKNRAKEESKESERKTRWRAKYRQANIAPKREDVQIEENISCFESTIWNWHPFDYSPAFFDNETVSQKTLQMYRKYLMESVLNNTSILTDRGLRAYVKNLSITEIMKKLEAEQKEITNFKGEEKENIQEEMSIIVDCYAERVKSLQNCLFGKQSENQYYKFKNWMNGDMRLSRQQLIDQIVKCCKFPFDIYSNFGFIFVY
jgi:hypothetical protein